MNPRLFDDEETNGDNPKVIDMHSCSSNNDDLINMNNVSPKATANKSSNVKSPADRKNGGKAAVSYALKFDESCRILFPLNFLCFNIFYWWYYLYYTT